MNASRRLTIWLPCCVVFLLSSSAVRGQSQNTTVRSPAGDRIAVIDINHIFKNHDRFKQMVNDWKQDVQNAEAKMKAENGRIEKMVADLKRFKPGTEDFKRREETIAKERANLQVQMQIQKKELMVEEAKMYLTVYEEIQKHVEYFSRRNGITLVLRFNRGNVNSEDPRQIQSALLRPVVFQNRIDITIDILNLLNPPSVGRQPSSPNSRIPRR